MTLHTRLAGTLLLLALSTAVVAQEGDEGFLPLSGEAGLARWRSMGADAWTAEGESIACSGEGSGWLRSDAIYGDFTLRFEYRIEAGGNSGVWLRAPLRGRQSAVGFEFQILGATAAAPNRNSTGSLYDIVAPRLDAGRPAGEWNEAEIRCLGTRVRAVLNGEELYDIDLADPALNATLPEGMKPADRNLRGYLGLTNHGAQVWYRNVRIRPEPEEGFLPLGGPGLEGWDPAGSGAWSADDGLLRCETAAETILTARQRVRDYTLRLRYRVEPGARGFVSLRRASDGRNRVEICLADDAGRPAGPESSGALRGLGVPRWNAALPAGEWNDLEITERGLRLDVRLNGVRVLDGSLFWYSGFYLPPQEGPLALAVTAGAVEFRDIRVRRLDDETP